MLIFDSLGGNSFTNVLLKEGDVDEVEEDGEEEVEGEEDEEVC